MKTGSVPPARWVNSVAIGSNQTQSQKLPKPPVLLDPVASSACNWYIPKFQAYILHGGPVSPFGFYLRCWEHTLLLFTLQITGKPRREISLPCWWANCELHQVDPLHLFKPKESPRTFRCRSSSKSNPVVTPFPVVSPQFG